MLTDISSATLRKMVKLSERKEALLAQIQELDRQMARLQTPLREQFIEPPIRARRVVGGARRPSGRRRAKRGALKASILAALRSAGKSGLTIGELSGKVGARRANLYVWFNGTGRRTRGIKKIGAARYRLG